MSVGESGQATKTPSTLDAYYPKANFTYQSKISDPYSSHSTILARVGDGKGKRLLDVGSAQGVLAQLFTQRGFEVTCIEGSAELAALGTDKCHEMIVADLDKPLPQLEGQFDVIVYGDILEHLRNPIEVLVGFDRALRPGGRVVVSVPNIAHVWVRLNLLLGRFPYGNRGILDRTHLRFFTLSGFQELLTNAGLEWSEIVATPVPLPLLIPDRYHGRILQSLHVLNAALARRWRSMFAYQFVAMASPRKGP
ncbi:MAG TPA: class I SAM-dependent methyltransferase [Verrucomicrobiae bacterium]|nr:class I SAM-dependent methyltransferase [Verrucomicrobiae bacterium]